MAWLLLSFLIVAILTVVTSTTCPSSSLVAVEGENLEIKLSSNYRNGLDNVNISCTNTTSSLKHATVVKYRPSVSGLYTIRLLDGRNCSETTYEMKIVTGSCTSNTELACVQLKELCTGRLNVTFIRNQPYVIFLAEETDLPFSVSGLLTISLISTSPPTFPPFQLPLGQNVQTIGNFIVFLILAGISGISFIIMLGFFIVYSVQRSREEKRTQKLRKRRGTVKQIRKVYAYLSIGISFLLLFLSQLSLLLIFWMVVGTYLSGYFLLSPAESIIISTAIQQAVFWINSLSVFYIYRTASLITKRHFPKVTMILITIMISLLYIVSLFLWLYYFGLLSSGFLIFNFLSSFCWFVLGVNILLAVLPLIEGLKLETFILVLSIFGMATLFFVQGLSGDPIDLASSIIFFAIIIGYIGIKLKASHGSVLGTDGRRTLVEEKVLHAHSFLNLKSNTNSMFQENSEKTKRIGDDDENQKEIVSRLPANSREFEQDLVNDSQFLRRPKVKIIFD